MTNRSIPDDIVDSDIEAEFERVPGLFRRWELEQLFVPGFEYHIEEHGRDTGGTCLFALYKRDAALQEVPT